MKAEHFLLFLMLKKQVVTVTETTTLAVSFRQNNASLKAHLS